jgi:methylmalonyl-CoA/ethylmalonyl-CoA epimerase
MQLHHVGCAVASIESSIQSYTTGLQFSRVSDVVEIASQQVRVCFIETAPSVYIELVEGLSDDAPVSSFLKRRQHYYHVCYSTPDVRQSVQHLEANGFRLLSVFASEAFNGADCAFLLNPEMALVELCTHGSFTLL